MADHRLIFKLRANIRSKLETIKNITNQTYQPTLKHHERKIRQLHSQSDRYNHKE